MRKGLYVPSPYDYHRGIRIRGRFDGCCHCEDAPKKVVRWIKSRPDQGLECKLLEDVALLINLELL